MAAGVPIVAARAACIPEIVQDAALLFEPLDAQACARSLAKVLTNPSLARRLVARGRKRAADFSWEQAAGQILGLFQEAAPNRENLRP
jgi:glycosyltransferase involved in cell wall biosynthesis